MVRDGRIDGADKNRPQLARAEARSQIAGGRARALVRARSTRHSEGSRLRCREWCGHERGILLVWQSLRATWKEHLQRVLWVNTELDSDTTRGIWDSTTARSHKDSLYPLTGDRAGPEGSHAFMTTNNHTTANSSPEPGPRLPLVPPNPSGAAGPITAGNCCPGFHSYCGGSAPP